MIIPPFGRDHRRNLTPHQKFERQLILMTTAPASLRKLAGTVMQAVRQLLEP
jgi:hypothetical protein